MTEPTQYKQRLLGLGPILPIRPALGLVVGGAAVSKAAVHAVFQAQDSFASSGRRIVSVAHLHGHARSEILDDTDPDAGTHDYPYRDPTSPEAYNVPRWSGAWHAASGHDVEQHATCLPSGPTETDVDDTRNGEGGAMVLIVDEVVDEAGTSAGGTSSTHTPINSSLEYAKVPTSDSPRVLAMGHSRSRMHGASATNAKVDAVSEAPLAFVSIMRRGAPRAHAIVVSETPRRYLRRDISDWDRASIHAYNWSTWTDSYIRQHYPDGTLYDEPRYGTEQAYATACRQADAAGPILAHAVFDSPFDRDPEDGILGLQIASGSSGFVDIFDSNASSWDGRRVGWLTPGYLSAPQVSSSHEASNGGTTCVVPVRFIANVSGGQNAILRVMSSPRSFIDLPVGNSSGGRWVSMCGYLEVMRSAEDRDPSIGGSVIQFFVDTASHALTIKSITVEYGHEPWSPPQLTPG
jgi:hypothetical protein